MPLDDDTARARLLDTAEDLFYARGVQAVGMDEIRGGSGVSLKRLYALYPAKEQLVEAYLRRRDLRWRGSLTEFATAVEDPRDRIAAVFDWLGTWFREPGFRGCAWINGYGELGATSAVVARLAREHKRAFADLVADLVADAGLPDALAPQLFLLAEGAMVSAAILDDPRQADHARAAAAALVAAS
ncbi:helix-turn-helix domain-containing protein [Umezawaea sp. Da 62-37]|uniref:TetR/AcrR family transcriptional regulator n=1 Tax=Umezawaea sp. Da 62-37 TaxID=3075927 RepID=UPI0028F7006E|nr:helix-turn-helix domain-containing protein [Umezawaea sp. Da 62-37]WNV89054.1 helix-turn-helix domain-containing protein [Umezawaea sp. Da 62-37]